MPDRPGEARRGRGRPHRGHRQPRLRVQDAREQEGVAQAGPQRAHRGDASALWQGESQEEVICVGGAGGDPGAQFDRNTFGLTFGVKRHLSSLA